MSAERVRDTEDVRYYHFRQNNSGGVFDFDPERGISVHVVVAAQDAEDANRRAERIGLYFDGVGDCECCGDRWFPAWGEGDAEPLVYGEPADTYVSDHVRVAGPEVFVHELNGTVTAHSGKG